MKIIYEFDTSHDSYDYQEHEVFKNSLNLVKCLSDLDEYIANVYKENTLIPTDELNCNFLKILQDNNISLDKLGW